MSAHTPGPWALELLQKWPFGVRVMAGEQEIFSQSAVCNSTKQNTRRDCEMGYGFDENATDVHWRAETARKWIAEQDANARLISAAPELLEALEGMVALAEQMNDASDEGGQLDARFDAARAAIAKAGGAA